MSLRGHDASPRAKRARSRRTGGSAPRAAPGEHARSLWAKAQAASQSAQVLLDRADTDGAVNRAYYAVFAANGLMDYRQKRQESRELDRQIKALQQQNAGMEKEIKALKSDPETIEKEARERLRYARPGEVVYTLSTPAVAPAPQKK